MLFRKGTVWIRVKGKIKSSTAKKKKKIRVKDIALPLTGWSKGSKRQEGVEGAAKD